MALLDELPGGEAKPRFLRVLDDPLYARVVELQDLVGHETAVFWRERNVRCVHLPITTASVSSPMGLGSDSLPVRVELASVPTYLADSMQFMLEYGCRLSAWGCYYVMPSFRAEQVDSMHLNEFFHSEAEIPGGLDDVVTVAESYVRHLAGAVLGNLRPSLESLRIDLSHIEAFLDGGTTRMDFDEAVEALDGDPAFVHVHDGWRTLTREGERRLMAQAGPGVWVTHFDHLSVPFYQAYDESGERALCADLLLGPGELIGCGERHTTGEDVRKALAAHEVPEADYAWYSTLKDARPMRTSGFGMGVERFFMWVLSNPDIRAMQLVERLHGTRLEP
jgi:asparaginyl-tRNA synthetase